MQAGVLGAVGATLGLVVPSFMIIYLISLFFDNFLEITVVANAFKGIKIAVGILITRAALNMWKKKKEKKLQDYVFAGIAMLIMLAAFVLHVNISTIVLISVAGIASVLCYKINQISNKGGAAS